MTDAETTDRACARMHTRTPTRTPADAWPAPHGPARRTQTAQHTRACVCTDADTHSLSRVSRSSFTLSVTVKMSFHFFFGSEEEERKVEVNISPSKKGAGR